MEERLKLPEDIIRQYWNVHDSARVVGLQREKFDKVSFECFQDVQLLWAMIHKSFDTYGKDVHIDEKKMELVLSDPQPSNRTS